MGFQSPLPWCWPWIRLDGWDLNFTYMVFVCGPVVVVVMMREGGEEEGGIWYVLGLVDHRNPVWIAKVLTKVGWLVGWLLASR